MWGMGQTMIKMLLNTIGSIFTKTKEIGSQTVETTKNAIEHGKAIRRLILLFISLVWLYVIQVAVRVYVTTNALDSNYTNLCMAITTMLGACYAFYFTGRSNEAIE